MRLVLILLVLLLVAATPAWAADTSLSGPTGTTSDPTFRFSASEPGATFECRVDGGDWQPCSSPYTVALPDGDHTLSVRALDAAGNADPTPATRAFTIDTSLVDTAIDAGPKGLTNDPTPSFTFGSATRGATFECMLEGAGSSLPASARCSSPLTVPALPSGSYVLAVRALGDRTPARRAFTVDADAPETAITGGPADGGESDSRSPAFRYGSEPGARFECRLDNKVKSGVDLVAWADCPAAGFAPAPLRGGLHTFQVRALDAAGNPDPSPATRTFRVVACERTVRIGLVEATGECLLDVGTEAEPRFESEGDVNVNGLPLPAPGPAKVVIDGDSISLSNLVLEIGGVKLYEGDDISWKLPPGASGEQEVASHDLSQGAEKLFGLELTGVASLRLGRRGDEYYSVLGLKVALPAVFKSGPSPGAGGVTGDVAIRVDRAHGVQLDGLKIAVENAYIGKLGVKRVCLSFVRAGGTFVAACEPPRIGNGNPQPFLQCRADNEADRWDGMAAVVLPTASSTELGLWAGLRAGRLSHAGAYVDKLGTLVPLAPGVFLERVALGVCLEPPPFQIKGAAAIAFGPDFNGHKAIVIDGSFQYTDGTPWTIRAEGSVTVFDKPLASAYLQYQSSGAIDFGFDARLQFGPVRMTGGVAGWVEKSRFNVAGNVEVCVDSLACAGARGVISSTGAAGCITVTLFDVPVPYFKGPMPWDWRVRYERVAVTAGAGYTWAERRVEPIVGTCSLGPWETQRAGAAQAGPSSLRVPEGAAAVAIGVRGRGGAPKVALVGPDGRRIVSPAHDGGAFVRSSHLLTEDADMTTVMIARPAAGIWRIEALPGSPPIAELRQAGTRPEPQVGAHVGRRVLDYSYVPQAGQRITFVERGPHTQQTLGSARGRTCKGRARRLGLSCGRIRFRPGAGGAGRRSILAVIEQDGLPRTTLTVARYTAPADAPPARPSVRVRRRGAAVRVAWRPAPGAARHNVVVRVGDGRRLLFIRGGGAGSLRVPRVGRYGVRATVRGMRLDGVEGRPATARLRGVR